MKHMNPSGLPYGLGDPLSEPTGKQHFIADRWEVLQLLKDTARSTGLGEREIAVLGAHLSVLPKGPVRSDMVLVSFAQVAGILERANCMDERRFRRGEARLEKLGFVQRRLSGNGRRFPVKTGDGRIVDAYGLDLRPLFHRIEELEQIRRAQAEEEQRDRALRSRISAAVSAVKRRALELSGYIPEMLVEITNRVRNLLRRRGATADELHAAEEELHAAFSRIMYEGQQEATSRTSTPPDRQPVDAGHSDRHTESHQKEYNTTRPTMDLSALRSAWNRLSNLSAFFDDPGRTEREMTRKVLDFSSFLGLGQQNALAALSILGWFNLAKVLDYMAGRIQEIQRPAPYLVSMLARYEAGSAIAGGRVCKGRSPA